MDNASVPDITFEERAEYERGFSAFFDKHIEPGLSTMEQQRVKVLMERPYRWIAGVTAFIVMLGISYLLLLTNADSDFTEVILRIFFILALVVGVWIDAPVRSFQHARKQNILPKVVEFFGLTYAPKGALSWGDVAASDIVRAGEEHLLICGDEVSGTYHGGTLSVTDVKTRYRSGKSTRQLYRGLFVCAKFQEPFRGQTVIIGNREQITDISESVAKGKLQPVELESNDFNKTFDVYSSDQVEARELLTPDIMERLLDLSRIHADAPIRCSYVNQKLYLAIKEPRDFFVPGNIKTSVYDTEELHDYLAEIHNIFSIVDILKLNRQKI